MISLMGSRTADAQESVSVPFLRGSVSFEGLELATWTKDVLVKGLLGALPQRVSALFLLDSAQLP